MLTVELDKELKSIKKDVYEYIDPRMARVLSSRIDEIVHAAFDIGYTIALQVVTTNIHEDRIGK